MHVNGSDGTVDATSATRDRATSRRHRPNVLRPLRSKLRPARSRQPLVPRQALIDSLARTRAPLVLVSAPAGAGKTTLLAQFADADDRPTAWLQVDEGDNDPTILLTYVAHALDRVAPVDQTVFDLLSVRTPPVGEQILPLIEEWLALAPPFLLVLDDVHLLVNEECWQLVGFVADRLSEGSHLLLGTRVDPPLPLPRLHAGGRLTEYRMVDLAMTRGEAARLLELHGSRADEDVLDELLRQTEGWVTGLCLALLAERGRPSAAAPGAVHGDRHQIAAYLTGEVLERQPQRVQRFLLRTSVLDALSADLCRAVTGDDDAHAILAGLARENVFISALDDHDEWYRYHHLFAELLRAELERRAPDDLADIHRAAAGWYHDHGQVEKAVPHWLAAGDVGPAAAPTARQVWELVGTGKVETARLMLDRFSEQQLREHDPLTVAAGYLYGTVLDDTLRGERWRRIVCAAEITGDEPMPGGGGTWREMQLGLRAFLAPDGIKAMLTDAELGLRLASRWPLDVQAEAKRAFGVACYLSGGHGRARRLFDDVVTDAGEPDTEAYALGFLSLIADDEGRWDEAARYDDEAAARCPGMTLDVSPGMFLALPMLLARTRRLARRGDPAWTEWRDRTETYLGRMVPPVPWRVALIAVVLGELGLQAGDPDETERWLTRGEEVVHGYPDAGMLDGRLRRLRQAFEQRRLADPLTPAEQRVLELLTTQLTAEQIARRLFVSLHTVKSHQRHLYAKLSVTTRTAAVERARELGLLAGPV